MGFLGSDVTPLTLSVQNVDANILRVKLGASGRFEVPQSLFQNTGQGRVQGNPKYGLQYSAQPFGFAVTRTGSSSPALFNTAGNRFVFKEQYLELTSSIPSGATLFGLGEYTSNVGFPLRRDGIPYTLWNRDQPPAVPNTNLYGSHPIILDVRDGGLCHGVMILNSNAMDIEITSSTLQIRAVGGVLDLYFFMGPGPMDVLNQMTSIVGRPVMPPYWSLGLMQSK
ncbi:hypothetical protein CVIRNUC_010117 [Coccomyxa viridis]|uniref:Glycoside hydrolase family 31 N-terminal domain-containing protein n=1 Tax=Coccomyxa viridis TaxID=1274662 RepID=A0AAV1IHS6_9CHLO|nr:hypothetical protein CVIRNUC_010117 [Coccomyxa viridis]